MTAASRGGEGAGATKIGSASRSRLSGRRDTGRPFASDRVPLYYQLATLLRQKITSRELGPGDQLPPESELVRTYGVSRMTVRQAVTELADEGLVQRQPGRGTFVTDDLPAPDDDIALDDSIADLISMGEATSVELLDLVELPASAEEARDLGLATGDPVIRCQRLRSFRGEPYCYIVNLVPPELGRRIGETAWRRGSVLKYIEDELGVPLRLAKQRIGATLADAGMARWLDVRIGDPLLLVDYHIRTDDDRPVEMARLFYRSDRFAFTLHLTRADAGDPDDVWALRKHRLEV